ncbi:MAG: hypothetical protein KAW41_04320 [Candidatus Diapherotrites archaeon]|nr:hypothetical protein [Candidatus Diapherotrites archaeon]
MDPASRMRQEMALEKFEKLNVVDRRRVLHHLNKMAHGKGYFNERDLREKKPYIWDQLCAEVVSKLF